MSSDEAIMQKGNEAGFVKGYGAPSSRRWSAEVTKHSDALDLEHNVFRSKDPRKIVRSLKHSAEQSKRRKGTPYQSAMSMLNFYIKSSGKQFAKNQRRILENAKQELRDVFGRA